jgi:alpha-1,3-rhamnosyl/mannosyltransferase
MVTALAAADAETRYTILVNGEDRGLFAGKLPANFALLSPCRRPRLVRLAFQQGLLPLIAAARRLDVVHSPSFIMPMIRGRARHLLTIHDMTSFSLPAYHIALRRSAAYQRAVLASIRRADLVTVPSEFVARDLLGRVPGLPPERVRVVGWGIGAEFRPRAAADAKAALAHLELPWPYILYVGALQPRKNLAGLLAAYRRLIDAGDVAEHLVIAGPLAWDLAEVLPGVDAPDLRGRVHRTGYVSDRDLPWLYAGARLFVYPSFGEGFGFPPLEAMASGVPTIASLGSALVENLEGAAALVPPDAPNALAGAMRTLLLDVRERERRIELGTARAARFRWQATASRLRDCYRELATARTDS